MHKKFIAKENVERGREHTTKKGKIIPEKRFIPQSICKCKTYCSTKIDIARQQEIFSTYYEQSNKSQKTLLIRASIKKTPTTSKRDPFLPIIPRKSREFNYKYFLTDSNGIEQEVCRSFMLGCYQITASSMNRAVKANRTSETLKQGVRNFINRFPKYESHYGRSDSEKKYLNSNLNLAIMYRMYKDDCEVTNADFVSEHMFRDIFNYEFNLSFKKRHTDTCKTCDTIKVNLNNKDLPNEERVKFENMQEEHDDLRKKIHAEFKRDVENADEDTIVLTFDLQKVLETPSVTTGIAFYKRQLATYNLCIVNEISNQAYMYMWSEGVAAIGEGKKWRLACESISKTTFRKM
ncbi:uncharacterized protein LOC143906548 [Temnothorax americanus]|uniref:uncharacterized protein LOC143906548 n=1 Tax=Temnothorax americanus TaxID=1964332 RepID=UPI0040676089